MISSSIDMFGFGERTETRTTTQVFSQCGTPGCTLHDFHAGGHSNQCVSNKRSRTTLEEKTNRESATDRSGQNNYGSLSKAGHRGAFVHAAKNCSGSIVYLEGPDGALTRTLISQGVSKSRLVPVNYFKVVAKSIEKEVPGVKCTVADICSLAAVASFHEFGVIWFDMCGVDFGAYEVRDLVHCAPTKFFTLSSRQILCVEQQGALCLSLVEEREKIIERALYTGISASLNMVFVVSKAKGSYVSDSKDSTKERIGIGTIVRVPLLYWKDMTFLDAYDFKTFEDGKYMYGSVHSQVNNERSQFRLTFQLLRGGTMLCSSKYSKSMILEHVM